MDIYAGNLPYSIDEGSLKETFSQYGAVENVKIVIDYNTGRSKGFAFVTMANSDEAHNAINELNGKEIDGRNIVVNEARQREERAPRGGGGGYGGGGRHEGGGYGGGRGHGSGGRRQGGGGGRGHGGGGGRDNNFRKKRY